MQVKRPRVAAIGLDDSRIKSIGPLCGDLRTAPSVDEYVKDNSWTETDVAVVANLQGIEAAGNVHVLTIAPPDWQWIVGPSIDWPGHLRGLSTDTSKNEREMCVPSACPEQYRRLAAELVRQLGRDGLPPPVLETSWSLGSDDHVLVETTVAPVAMRFLRPHQPGQKGGETAESLVLALPGVTTNLSAWFRAFLCDVNEFDPDRVPQAPPRLGNPSQWYTPKEKKLARQIAEVTNNIERFKTRREDLRAELDSELERASSTGIRRVLWADGDDLVAAVKEILSSLGLAVRDMDNERQPGEPKREDLRLTLDDRPEWEAIVEVKGYTRGTRTNDARQIREHRDHYTIEKGRAPDLTLWIVNPYRTEDDPSLRPPLAGNVINTAEIIEAVVVLASDLYRQWVLVEEGSVEASDVVRQLVEAPPGRWEFQQPVG